MPLSIITATTDSQLTTTSAVKQAIGLAATSTGDDAYLDTLITRASAWASEYVGYPLSLQAYLETLPSYGTRRLTVSRTPMRAVSGLFAGTDSGDYLQVESSEFAVSEGAGFLERNIGWEWTAPVEGDLTLRPRVGQEFVLWRAEYVAGYTHGGISTDSPMWSTEKGTTSTGRTLPYDIEQAIVNKVASVFGGNEGVAEKAVGDLRIRYGSFGAGSRVVDQASLLLEPHRRF